MPPKKDYMDGDTFHAVMVTIVAVAVAIALITLILEAAA